MLIDDTEYNIEPKTKMEAARSRGTRCLNYFEASSFTD